jgi:hypothetical protein
MTMAYAYSLFLIFPGGSQVCIVRDTTDLAAITDGAQVTMRRMPAGSLLQVRRAR